MTFNVGSLVPFMTGEDKNKLPKSAKIILLLILGIVIATVIFLR